MFAVNSLPSSLPFLSSFFFVLSASPPPFPPSLSPPSPSVSSLPYCSLVSPLLSAICLPPLPFSFFSPPTTPFITHCSHNGFRHSLLTVPLADSVTDHSPFTLHSPSSITHRLLCTVRHPLLTVHTAQSVIHYSPFTLHSPSSITHRSHCAVRHPLLTVHSAQSVIHYSPFTLHSPSSITHRSLFRLHYSLLIVHSADFTIHCSPLTLQTSSFFFLPVSATDYVIVYTLFTLQTLPFNTHLSLILSVHSPDVILCGGLGLQRQLTN